MRWVLPGGAILGESNREDHERTVACRPLAAVQERKPPPVTVDPVDPVNPVDAPTTQQGWLEEGWSGD